MLVAPVSEGHPLLPSIATSFPSGVNFFTVWSRSSVQYTVSSGPIVIPCGRTKRLLSPRADESALAVEDDDGMVAPVEDEDPVVRVGRDAGDLDETPPSGNTPQPSQTSKRGSSPSAIIANPYLELPRHGPHLAQGMW